MAELLAAYLAVPVAVLAVVALTDRSERSDLARADKITIVVAVMLWPVAAVAIFRGWLSDRRDRRNRQIKRSDR